jgi:uncharacterized membrane protein YcaP (DUF421 family)
MDFLWRMDWKRMFVPEMSLPEILIRGVLIYLALCLLLRVILKREAGKMSLSDLLLVTLVAGVCRNPLVRDAYSITDGILVVMTVLFTGYAVDWLYYHVSWIHALLHSPPVPLIHDGEILRDNLRNELLTEDRLQAKLRGKGVREPAEVADAWMEGEGKISVIKKDSPPADGDVSRMLDKIAEQQQVLSEIKEMLSRLDGRREPSREAGQTDGQPDPLPHTAERP